MKLIKITPVIIFCVMVFSILSSCSNNNTKSEVAVEIAPENVLVADYEIEGMVCAMGCAKTIQDELTGMNGISACNVNFEEGSAHIEFDKTQLTEKDIIAKIEGMAKGQYKVAPLVDRKQGESPEPVIGGEKETEETVSEVSLSSIKIPNIFTLLLNQL